MKFLLIFLIIFSGFLYSQDGLPGMIGNYGDFGLVPGWEKQPEEFTFARLIYNGRIPEFGKNWYTDYPKGDATLIEVVKRLTNINIAKEGRAIPLHHPDLFNYPMIYSSEAGQMIFDESDVKRMREYLQRGGFWIIDDFWGTVEWNNFEREMKKIFPDKEIADVPLDNPIFHTVFDIEEIITVPNVFYAYCGGCSPYEQDGFEPKVRGIFDNKGQLAVVIFFNTDTMDALEWADDPLYPHYFSAYAYKIFINTIIYAMTH